ncbi:hypothetical protein [Massilia consociata]|uniref:Uncharacterized protein n=1 Tax=Massilia consociata TaxID=760117 RepID=A0ABV6FBE7_9BURK
MTTITASYVTPTIGFRHLIQRLRINLRRAFTLAGAPYADGVVAPL